MHPAWKICRYSVVSLPYLQKQNSWQSQWLLFATTNKRYTACFRTFLYHYRSSNSSIIAEEKYRRIVTQ